MAAHETFLWISCCTLCPPNQNDMERQAAEHKQQNWYSRSYKNMKFQEGDYLWICPQQGAESQEGMFLLYVIPYVAQGIAPWSGKMRQMWCNLPRAHPRHPPKGNGTANNAYQWSMGPRYSVLPHCQSDLLTQDKPRAFLRIFQAKPSGARISTAQECHATSTQAKHLQ